MFLCPCLRSSNYFELKVWAWDMKIQEARTETLKENFIFQQNYLGLSLCSMDMKVVHATYDLK